MTETSIHKALHDSVLEVLEKMFFIEAGDDAASDAAPGMLVEVAFDGDPPGVFRMSLAHTAAALIAADFLGEDADSVTAHQVDEVAKELANMICGAVLSRIESSATFRLSAPALVAGRTADRVILQGTLCAVETGSGILTAGIDMGKKGMLANRKIRILIVDDSAIVRKILTEALSGEADMEVVGTAPDPFVARDKILALRPDVLTLDIEMPRMDGLTFLKKLMHFHPLPTVVISSLAQHSCHAAVQALEFGAVEVLAKPGGPYSVGELTQVLAAKIRAAASARVRKSDPSPTASAPPTPPPLRMPTRSPAGTIIAIGASTGGTEAIASVLTRLPQSSPGIVIAQHIPPVFSKAFANRLNEICALEVKEAVDGDVVCPGRALVAPGDFHMVLRNSGGRYTVTIKTGPRVCYQRPSVDVLFMSVAECAGKLAVGVLLTGMGSDGAKGLLQMRRAGAHTIAQDEATCVVYGMPREAVELNAAAQILPLAAVPQAMMGTERS